MKEEIIEDTSHPKERKTFIVLFLFIVVLIVIGFTILANRATPKKVFEMSFDKILTALNPKMDFQTVSGSFDLTANFLSSEEKKQFDIINNFAITNHYEMDKEKNIATFSIDSTYREKEFLNFDLYMKENSAYLHLFDRFLEIPVENVDFDSQEFSENYDTILLEVQKAIHKSLKNDYFSSEKATIVLDNKETNVTKNKFNLTIENQKTFYKDIIRSLNNDSFLKSVATITKKTEKEIQESLEELLEEEMNVTENIVISIFTSGMLKNFTGFEVNSSSNVIQVLRENKNYFTYSFDGEEKINGNVKISNDSNHFALVLTILYDDMQATFTLKNSTDYNTDVQDVTITDSIPYNELTNEEQNAIVSALQQNEGMVLFLEDIQKLLIEHKSSVLYD